MDSDSKDQYAKLIEAQTHVLNENFSFIRSIALKCAFDLSIPEIINKYGQPMPLSQLIASLSIHPSKVDSLNRMMRILTHSGMFSEHNVTDNDVSYGLTDASALLLKDHPFSMSFLLHLTFDPHLFSSYLQFSKWFTNEDHTPFHTQNGMAFWELAGSDPKFNHIVNTAMASSSGLASSVVTANYKRVFEGLKSLVDIGGGTGSMAKAIAKSFPQLNCTVFDLPHVVAELQASDNLKYVGGDMFDAIPSADGIMLKHVLHNWNDEECVKILSKCKEALTRDGKVIILEAVLDSKKENKKLAETELFFDIEMMAYVTGKERTEKEWAKLIFSAGFSDYKVSPAVGIVSIIEVYP